MGQHWQNSSGTLTVPSRWSIAVRCQWSMPMLDQILKTTHVQEQPSLIRQPYLLWGPQQPETQRQLERDPGLIGIIHCIDSFLGECRDSCRFVRIEWAFPMVPIYHGG